MSKRKQRGSSSFLKFKNAIRGSRNPLATLWIERHELEANEYEAAFTWLASTVFHGEHLVKPGFPLSFSSLYEGLLLPMDLEREIAWAVETLKNVSGRLNDFRILAQKFSRALMSSDSRLCTVILDQVEARFGKSLWLIKNRIAVLQRFEGFDAQKKFLNGVRAECESGGILQFLAHYVSVRNEAAISPGPFESMYTKRVLEQPIDEYLGAYLRYHVLERTPVDPSDCAAILAYETASSAIDYYETLVAVGVEWYRTSPSIFRKVMRKPMASLAEVVVDERLSSLVYFADHSTSEFPHLERIPMAPYDLFLSAEYESAFAGAMQELAVTSDSFEMIELGARAAHCAGLPIYAEPLLRDIPFNREVSERMRSMLAKDLNADENRIQLQKTALNFAGLDWASSIRSFCERETSSKPLNEAVHVTTLRLEPPLRLNPLYLPALRERKSDYEMACGAAYGGALTLRYAAALNSQKAETVGLLVSRSHEVLAQAEQYIVGRDYESALAVISVDDPLPYFVNKGIRLKAHCLLQLGRVGDCIRYITEIYASAPQLYAIIPIAQAVELVPQPEGSGLVDDISLPVLYDMYSRHIATGKDYLRQYALEDFLAAYGLERPSEIATIWQQFDRTKLVYLLKHLCVPHIMDSSPVYGSSQELEDERIAVCQFLATIDDANKGEYQSEITAITLRQVVQRGMRQIEQTKIYVDVEGIKETASRELREGFNRYLAFESSKYASQHLIDELKQAILKSRSEAIDVILTLKLPKDEKTDILRTLIADIRDEFVSSTEHGLNGYLSVRIRHGTFSGELRSPLEAAHLLTQRERGSTEYRLNEYWPDRLGLVGPMRTTIGRRLAEFSRQFDGLVERILKEWIQIRTSDQDSGVFDFRIFDSGVRALAVLIRPEMTFEQFLDEVLDAMWQTLDSSLARMRERLSTELRKEIEDLISSLQADLKRIADDENLSQMENLIANARTEMSRTLGRVTDWFKLPMKTSSEPFPMSLAVSIAIETVRHFYSQSPFSPAIDAADNIQVTGAMLPSIVDILVIIFDNIVKHSDCSGPPAVRVSISRQPNAVQLSVENEVGGEARTDIALKRLEAIRSGIEAGQYKSAVTGEGGTGLFKIRKILEHDFGVRASMSFGYTDAKQFHVKIGIPAEELVL